MLICILKVFTTKTVERMMVMSENKLFGVPYRIDEIREGMLNTEVLNRDQLEEAFELSFVAGFKEQKSKHRTLTTISMTVEAARALRDELNMVLEDCDCT